MTDIESYKIIFGFAVLFALFGIFWFFISWFLSELEHRLGREPTWLECLALGLCFPYSLLIIFVMPDKSRKSE